MKTVTYDKALDIAQKDAVKNALDFIRVVGSKNSMKLAIAAAWSDGLTFSHERFERDYGIKIKD